ncbi:MAG: hypothetical protein WCI41_00645 [bacterium]
MENQKENMENPYVDSIVKVLPTLEITESLSAEVIRISKLFISHLESKSGPYNNKSKKEITLSVNKRKELVMRILKILVEAYVSNQINLTDIQNGKDVEKIVKKLGNLKEIRTWLEGKGNIAQDILKQSKTEMTFQALYGLKLTNSTRFFYDSLEAYQSKTEEMYAWMRMVSFFIDRKSSSDKRNFMDAWGIEKAWNLSKIMSFFLVNITLEIDKKELEAEDLCDFWTSFGDYDQWEKDIERKIITISDEGQWLWKVYKGSSIQRMIDQWKKSKSNFILETYKSFPVSKESRDSLDKLDTVFKDVLSYGRGSVKRRDENVDDIKIRNRVDRFLIDLGIKFLHEFFSSRQYLLKYISFEMLSKIVMYDISMGGKKILESNCPPDFYFSELKKKKKSLLDFFTELITEDKPFGFSFESLVEDRKNFNKRKTNNQIVELERGIINIIGCSISDISFKEFIHSIIDQVDLSAVPLEMTIAMYLLGDDTPVIVEKLNSYKYFSVLKHVSFKKYFDYEIHKKIEERNNNLGIEIIKD